MRPFTFCTALALIVGTPFIVHAEDRESVQDPERGRLADGRAFRTDAQGNQLVDYIAELELSVETLQRRVQGLEGEVNQKQKLLDSAGVAQRSGSLVEKDLVSAESGGTKAVAKSARAPEPKLFAPSEEANHTSEQELVSVRAELEASKRELSEAKTNRSAETTDLKNVISSLERDLASRTKEVATLRQEAQSVSTQAHSGSDENAVLRSQINSLSQELTKTQSETDLMRTKYQESSAKVRDLESKLSESEARLVAVKNEKQASSVREVSMPVKAVVEPDLVREPVLADLKPESDRQTPKDLFEERGKPFYSEAKARAVESVRGSLGEQVEKVRQLVTERDRLYRGYQPKSASVRFRPSNAVSSRNRSIDAIDRQVELAGSVNELTTLKIDLTEIRRKVEDDIALIRRMGNAG